MSIFGSSRNPSSQPPKIKSPAGIDLESKEKILEWFDKSLPVLRDMNRSWHNLCRDNISVYTGHDFPSSGLTWQESLLSRLAKPSSRKSSWLSSIIETHVARLTGSRANISVSPVHSSEYGDRTKAKTSEQVIKTILKDRGADALLERLVRHCLICGVAYLEVFWNPEIGPSGEEGAPLGDVDFRLLQFDQILTEPAPPDEMNWYVTFNNVHIEELKATYGDQDFSPNHSNALEGNVVSSLQGQDSDSCTVITLVHRPCKTIPEGLEIKITGDKILSAGKLPCDRLVKARRMPLCVLYDIIPPGNYMPLPLTVMEAAKGPQMALNVLDKIISRNISLSSPKWMSKLGSVSKEQLDNSSNIVEYRTLKPELISPNSVPAELFNYRQTLINDLHQTSGAFKQSFGEAAPNTRASVMLEFHEEQEFKRAEPLIKRYNNLITEASWKALMIASCYYKDEDNRKIKVLADKSGSSFRRFLTTDLEGEFDIRIERISALPDSKEGKLRWLTQLISMFPGKFDWEQVKAALDFGGDPGLKTAETSAFEMQLLENDMLLLGTPLKAPEEHQDHISHLKAAYPLIDSIELAEMPAHIQKLIFDHVRAHEMMAWQKAAVSPTYAQILATSLPLFPKLFVSMPSVMPINPTSPMIQPAVTSLANQATSQLLPNQKPAVDPTRV